MSLLASEPNSISLPLPSPPTNTEHLQATVTQAVMGNSHTTCHTPLLLQLQAWAAVVFDRCLTFWAKALSSQILPKQEESLENCFIKKQNKSNLKFSKVFCLPQIKKKPFLNP